MIKNSLILVFSIFFLNSSAQSAFDKYENKDGVGSILVNKKMFLLMANVKVDASDSETQQYLNLIKKLDDLKVFTTSSAAISIDMKLTAENYRKTNSLDEVLNENEGLKVWIKTGNIENQLKELLMFSEESNTDKQTILLSLKGIFTINEINILMKKMKIQGVEALKKIPTKK
jgi:hypothetical protein